MKKSSDNKIYLGLAADLLRFSNEIRTENRFHLKNIFAAERIFEFAMKRRAYVLLKGTKLYRSRVNPSNTPLSMTEMGAPPPGKRSGGRLNPEGIACLYCATDEVTAVSEIRPWVGSHITVVEVESKEKLKLIDFAGEAVPRSVSAFPDSKTFFQMALDNMFSSRFNPEDTTGYLPTQYLAEYFKVHGYDGLRYHSSLSESGKNIALFNEDGVKFLETRQVKVTQVEYRIADLLGKVI